MDYRIEDRRNAYLNGRAVTMFSIYERRGNGYIHVGKSYALGHDASESECIDAWQLD